MRQYKIIYDSETLIKKIDDLITIRAENKWSNHFKYVLKYFLDNKNENILGNKNSESFCIWQCSHVRGGIFYPVIVGTIANKNGSSILELKIKLNVCGKLVSIFVFSIMMIGAILVIF